MKKVIIGIVIGLAVVVGICLATGTIDTGEIISTITMGNDDLIRVDGKVVSAPEARLFLIAETYEISQAYGQDIWSIEADGQTMADYMMQQMRDDMIVMMELVAIGKANGVELSQTEEQLVTDAADYYYSQMTDSERSYFDGRRSDVEHAFSYYAYAMKTIRTLAGSADSVVTDDEARVIIVQQVVTTDRNAAQAVCDRWQNGWDFADLMFNYSIGSQDELTITRQSVSEEYAAAAFALQNEEISEPFESDGSWYVVYCVNNYVADLTEQNRAAILTSRQQEAVLNYYQDSLSGMDIFINEPAWETFTFFDGPVQTAVSFWSVYENYFS